MVGDDETWNRLCQISFESINAKMMHQAKVKDSMDMYEHGQDILDFMKILSVSMDKSTSVNLKGWIPNGMEDQHAALIKCLGIPCLFAPKCQVNQMQKMMQQQKGQRRKKKRGKKKSKTEVDADETEEEASTETDVEMKDENNTDESDPDIEMKDEVDNENCTLFEEGGTLAVAISIAQHRNPTATNDDLLDTDIIDGFVLDNFGALPLEGNDEDVNLMQTNTEMVSSHFLVEVEQEEEEEIFNGNDLSESIIQNIDSLESKPIASHSIQTAIENYKRDYARDNDDRPLLEDVIISTQKEVEDGRGIAKLMEQMNREMQQEEEQMQIYIPDPDVNLETTGLT